MGIIKVRGSAKKDFEADLFRIKIQIIARSKQFGEAMFSGKNRTEHFLKLMEDRLGIKPEDFTAGDFSVSQSYGSSGLFTFEKAMSVSVNADLALVENISILLEEMSDMDYRVEAELTNEKEKENEVLSLAIRDSRARAEAIAESLGQKVVGAEESNFEFYDGSNSMERNQPKCLTSEDINNMASKLKKPTKTIQQSINISWITE